MFSYLSFHFLFFCQRLNLIQLEYSAVYESLVQTLLFQLCVIIIYVLTFNLIQVKNLNFYDVVLDFILMDSFEDLENPPTSIQNVVNNRWLNSSFKETVSGGLLFSTISV